MSKRIVSFNLNGKKVETMAEDRELLVHVLREQLGQTGTHIGCETTHCGVCTVDVDGESVKSCTILAAQVEGGDVITVEGLANSDGLHIVQQAFIEEHGLQCGFCTTGMMMRAHRFLQETPDPTEEEIRYGMAGNLCRCTGYQNIISAVQLAAQKLQQAKA